MWEAPTRGLAAGAVAGGGGVFTNGIVTLMVADLDQAIRFYTETLGLKLTERYAGHWAAVRVPGLTIGLHPGGAPAPRPAAPDDPASPTIGLEVEDLPATVATLTARGVRITRRGDGTEALAFFSDPDGHGLYLRGRSQR
jgi:catechol 2,3-dioxygenase-like lactoylglutathione lyase family enzyme